MDVKDKPESGSNYKASKAVMGSSSSLPENLNTSSKFLSDASSESRWQSGERSSFKREVTTPPLFSLNNYHQISSTPPSLDRILDGRSHFQILSQRPIHANKSDHSLLESPSKSSQQSLLHPLKEMTNGKTAREVAEGAQDEMLVKAGLQRSPAHLIEKVARPDSLGKPPMHYGKTAGVCNECRRKKIRCLHKDIQYDVNFGTVLPTIERDEVGHSVRKRLFPNLHEEGSDSIWHDEEDEIKPDLTKLSHPERKHGRPSRWRERRAKEDARVAQQQSTQNSPGDTARDSDLIPKRKPGRPVGWRKEMGISYADYKQLYGLPEPEEGLHLMN